MANATVQADVHDARDDITIATGTPLQSKAVMVVFDDTKIAMADTLAIETTLRRIAEAIRAKAPIKTQ